MVIEFYTAEDGSRPAKEYLSKLTPTVKAYMFEALDLLEEETLDLFEEEALDMLGEQGKSLDEPYMIARDGGIYELSARVDGIKYAIYLFFTSDGSTAILTSGHTLTEYEAFKLEQLQRDLTLAEEYRGRTATREPEAAMAERRLDKYTIQEIEQAKKDKAEYMKRYKKR